MDMKTVSGEKKKQQNKPNQEQSGVVQDFHAWERKINMVKKQRQLSGVKDSNWYSFMLGWCSDVRNTCEAEKKKG